MFNVVAPLSVPITKSKRLSLNMNVYRNTNFHSLNRAKEAFTRIMLPRIKGYPKMDSIHITYTLFPARGGCDVANICSIVDKFFSDTVVKAKIIEDDNIAFLKKVSYVFGSVDSSNPRVEICVEPYQPEPEKEPDMRILLDTDSVKKALIELLAQEYFTLKPGKSVVPHILADGSIEVEIVDVSGTSEPHPLKKESTDETGEPDVGTAQKPEHPASAPEPAEPTKRKYTRRPKVEESTEEDEPDVTAEKSPRASSILDEIQEDIDSGSDELNDDEQTTTEEEDAAPRPRLSIFPRSDSSEPDPAQSERKTPFAGLRRPLNPR